MDDTIEHNANNAYPLLSSDLIPFFDRDLLKFLISFFCFFFCFYRTTPQTYSTVWALKDIDQCAPIISDKELKHGLTSERSVSPWHNTFFYEYECISKEVPVVPISITSTAAEESKPIIELALVTCECTYVREALQKAFQKSGTKEIAQAQEDENTKSVLAMSNEEVIYNVFNLRI
jgi:hypothetical protein